MTNPEVTLVVDRDGLQAQVEREHIQDAASKRVEIRLEDGRTVLVEKTLLQVQPDGSYYLPLALAEVAEAADQLVVPVVEEEVHVTKREVESGHVRIHKTVDEREVLIDQPLLQELVEVSRVPVNQMVETAPEIRHEGDTMIIPVLEEVVVVDIKLMVREEIHVKRTQQEARRPQTVTLRREDVIVERDEESNGGEHT